MNRDIAESKMSVITNILLKRFSHVLLIAMLGFLVYSNTLNAPFQWDEDDYIVENPMIKHPGYFMEPSKAKGLPLSDTLKNRYIGYLTFALNYKIHGLETKGFHAVNIAVHILNAILVYILITLTLRTPFLLASKFSRHGPLIAFFSALLFVSHPVQTEAVTYIFQRLASLSSFFYLASVISYLYSRLSAGTVKKVFFYSLSLLSAVLAMKTKENTFTLPFVIALYEFLFFHGSIKKKLLHVVPMLLTLPIIPVTLIGMESGPWQTIRQMATVQVGFNAISKWDYLFTQFRVIITYVRLLLLPVGQNIDHDYPVYTSFFIPGVFLSFAFLLFMCLFSIYLICRSRRENPEIRLIGLGILWFFITLSVESSLIPIPMLIDEYRVYLPSVGFFTAAISGCFFLAEKVSGKIISVLSILSLVIITCIFSGAAYMRNEVWKSRVSLWEDVVNKNPKSARGYINLGIAYMGDKKYDKAIEMFDKGIAKAPEFVGTFNNRGTAYYFKGQYSKAIEDFNRAIVLNPDNDKSYNARGAAYLTQKQYDRAIKDFNKAIALNPFNARPVNNLGELFFMRGELDRAIEYFKKAIEIEPAYGDAYSNLGVIYNRRNQFEPAIENFTKALSVKYNDAPAYINLGLAYYRKGEYDMAIQCFNKGIKLKPEEAAAINNLGLAYYKKGEYDMALESFNKALKIKNDYDLAYNNRGLVYLKKLEYDRAVMDFDRAIGLTPDYAEAYKNRGIVFGIKGLYDRAIMDFDKAVVLDPGLVQAFKNRGVAHMKRGNKNKAVPDFRKACGMGDRSACSSLQNITKNKGEGYFPPLLHRDLN